MNTKNTIKEGTPSSHSFKKAFTLIELIVVITILAILGTIGFLSIGGYSSKARDSARIGDTAQISKSLDLSIITSGTYPNPDNAFSVTYSGGVVWNQGTVGTTVMQYLRGTISGGGLNKKPVDPLKNTEYTYSSLAEGRAYQLKTDYEGDIASVTFENPLLDTALAAPGDPTIAYIRGNYGGLTAKTTTGSIVYILAIPSIITNSGTTTGGFLSATSLSGTLMFHGKSLRNASSFNPGALIFSGAKTTTNPSGLPDTSTGVITMMNTLKSVYGVSDIQNLQQVTTLMNTSTGSLATFGASIISTQLGGSAVSTGGGGGTVTTQCSPGTYSVNGNTPCTPASAGSFVSGTGATSQIACTAGFTSPVGSTSSAACVDQTPPTGGNFTMPTTTSTTTVALTITCPTDAANSTPIQMYISGAGLATGGNTWETCTSTKNITVTTGDGSKAITMKWRDSVGNESGVVSGSVVLTLLNTLFSNIQNKSLILSNINTQLGGQNYFKCAGNHDTDTVRTNCGYENLIYLVRAVGYDYGIYYKSLPSTFHTDSWIYNAQGFLFSSAWPNNVLQDNGTLQNLNYIQTNIMSYRGRSVGAWYSNSHLWCSNGSWSQSYELLNRPCVDYSGWNNPPSILELSVYKRNY